jgi:hypothetical protein
MKTPQSAQRLEVILSEVERFKKKRVHRADLLRLIEALALHLKLELHERKGEKR